MKNFDEKALEIWRKTFHLNCYACKNKLTGPYDTRKILTGYRPDRNSIGCDLFNGGKTAYICSNCHASNKQKYQENYNRVTSYAIKNKERLKKELDDTSYYDGRKIE